MSIARSSSGQRGGAQRGGFSSHGKVLFVAPFVVVVAVSEVEPAREARKPAAPKPAGLPAGLCVGQPAVVRAAAFHWRGVGFVAGAYPTHVKIVSTQNNHGTEKRIRPTTRPYTCTIHGCQRKLNFSSGWHVTAPVPRLVPRLVPRPAAARRPAASPTRASACCATAGAACTAAGRGWGRQAQTAAPKTPTKSPRSRRKRAAGRARQKRPP
jgi:hypothetical protein